MRNVALILLLMVCNGFAAQIFSIHEGDSLTQGQSTSNYVYQLSQRVNDSNVQFTNIGLSGDYIASNTAASDTISQLTSAGTRCRTIAVLEMGINDISAGYTTAQVTTNFLSWINAVKAASPTTKIVQFTIMGTVGIGWGSDRDIIRSNVNDWITATAPVDVVIDQAKDPRMWTNNPTYFADGTHPNDLGYFIMASNCWYGMNGASYFACPPGPTTTISGKVSISGSVTIH